MGSRSGTPRRGRRPGTADTRHTIAQAARQCFGDRGFDGTTIRAVADRAGVDPALVHHYYGSKQGLFLQAMEIPFDPVVTAQALGGIPRERAGEAVLRHVLPIWHGPHRADVTALLRLSLGDRRSSTALQDVLIDTVAAPVLRLVGVPEDEVVWRAPLLESVVLGLLVSRLVMVVPVVRDLDVEQVVRAYAPVLQRFISAPREELLGAHRATANDPDQAEQT